MGSVVADGLLFLDETVSDLVPELGDSAYARATVRQLLDMTASLSFDHDYVDPAAEVHMMDRATGRPRGFGFITMSTPEEAEKAIEAMNGKPLDGRNLTVNIARPREERPPGGGGGGGRREYGGGGGGGRNRY